MLAHHETLPGGTAHAAFTDRWGGVSGGPLAELNLGDHVGDDPDAVQDNRRRVARALGARALVVARQVHGRQVAVVDAPFPGQAPEADGLVTRTPGLALAVLVADCTPVVLLAPDEGVAGVAHAGREGLRLGVVTAVVEAMRELGAQRIVGRVGPSVCPRCYEVPAALRDEVAATAPVAASVTRTGTASLDIAGGVLAQLAPDVQDLRQVLGCTMEDPALFSYRRDRTTGRSAGIALLSEFVPT